MKLARLLADVDVVASFGDGSVDVQALAHDSREVVSGTLFVAIPGERRDGNDFVPEAVARGSVAVVSERPPEGGMCWVQVRSARVALAVLAAGFFGHPSRDLCLVGITGTNGKTTTAHLVDSVFRRAGYSASLLGTTGYRGGGIEGTARLTTPEAPELERWFRRSVDAGGTHAVMEVSSHAIAMHRVHGLDFDVAVFTNLSPEHLDFHRTMEAYFDVKSRLFRGLGSPPPPVAVVNQDDPWGRRLPACGNTRRISYGMTPDAMVCPLEARLDWSGLRAEFETPLGRIPIRSALLGRTNLYNVAAALAVAVGLEIPGTTIAEGIAALEGVPGRFERVESPRPFNVVVDYAHTDDALARVLAGVRELTAGRVTVVFGAGGERDTAKRSRMGAAAAAHSDRQIVTSDNPRGEDPDRIMQMIEEGLRASSGNYSLIADRREAIRAALRDAGPNDTVVIAGKGHETTQLVGDRALPFDDRVVAGELLDELDA